MATTLLKPKEVTIKDQDGIDRKYIVSRIPAIPGREIVTQYPLSAMPKVGDYAVNEALMLKLMAFVAVVKDDGTELILNTRALVDNHVPEWETLAKLEVAMMEHNVSFFRDGRALSFFGAIAQQARQWISPMLTDLLAQSSQKAKQPSTSSGPSTT